MDHWRVHGSKGGSRILGQRPSITTRGQEQEREIHDQTVELPTGTWSMRRSTGSPIGHLINCRRWAIRRFHGIPAAFQHNTMTEVDSIAGTKRVSSDRLSPSNY